MEDFRRLHPYLTRFNRAGIIVSLILAALCLPLAIVEPEILVLAAFFVAFAGMLRFVEWLSAKGTTPAERKMLEQRLRERAARRQSRRS